MSDIVDKLKSPPPPMMVPGCTTCRHLGHRPYSDYLYCDALGGLYADRAYENRCKGNLWEPHPPPVPVLVRFKRWLIG